MLGPIVLVGSGEFSAAMEAIDRDLLAATGRARPRVAILPTASFPDGEETFLGWIERGRAHFSALGAEVEGVEIRTRVDAFDDACVQAIGEADLVYLSGGKPDHLLDALDGTPAGAALHAVHERGGILAGCSAGAMVLAARQPWLGGRRFFRFPTGWRDALGFVEGAAVLPHYDAFPEPLAAVVALAAPRGTAVLGIDEETAAIVRDGTWRVCGRGRVTVWRGRARTRHRLGESFRLDGPEGEPTPGDVDGR
ncbi:MAG TPA: Type 1 glutamine amidotransferase-like domain-containing protein [Candidatus Nanopelagicales bacterium]|nr:Type 1 glutamine amidotransferase-like domain-containing protein [Candidatus Nanopelagicales bacterium]